MKKIIAPLLLLIPLLSSAQTAFTLSQAIDYAVKNGYSVKNSMTDVEIARKKIVETRGIGLPQLSTDASYQNFLQVPVSLIEANAFDPTAPEGYYLRLPFGVKHNISYGYTASWLLFNGEYLVGLQASRTYLEYSKTNLRKSEIEIKESVTRAYYTVLVLQENKRILEENIQNLDNSIRETSAIYTEGFAEALDVDRLSLLKKNLESMKATLEQSLVMAQKLLKFTMGYDVNAEITLSDNLQTALQTAEVEEQSPRFELSSNIDYLLLQNSQRLQELQRKRLRANYLPTLSTFYTWKETRLNNSFSEITDPTFRVPGGTIFGLNLSMPVFQGFSQRARVQQASLELQKLDVLRKQQEQGYMLQSAQALTEFQTARANYANTREAVELAEKIRRQAEIKYKEGVGSSIEVIQAQNELLTAQSNFINAVQQLLTSRISLDKQLNKF